MSRLNPLVLGVYISVIVVIPQQGVRVLCILLLVYSLIIPQHQEPHYHFMQIQLVLTPCTRVTVSIDPLHAHHTRD